MSSPSFAIYLFGPLRVLIQGEPMPRVRTRSVEWLLALLVLRHGRVVDRSWLAGTLWPDSDENQALRNLREDLVRLRKALGGQSARLQSPSRDTLSLDLEGAEVDLIAFDAAMQVGDEASLRSAIRLYTGALLEGCYADWLLQERDRRDQACLNALETLAELTEQRGDFSEALALLRRAEGMDRLRDSIQRRLMQVLTESGDTPAALMTYREHRLRLHREMNVEPDEETTGLFQQLRATGKEGREKTEGRSRKTDARGQKMEAPPSGRDYSPPASLPHPLTALIGRDAAVREVVGQVGASRLVTLAGTGGVGKTRLCIQAAHEAAEQFLHGAVFVALAPLADGALLPAYLASALGLREEGSADANALLETLVGWFSTHDALLVLDNCEHLIEATAPLTQTLLDRCGRLHILATSRQRLGLTGEVVWRVPSLPCPDLARLPAEEARLLEEVRQSPAVQLFVERARMVRSGFRLTGGEEAKAVAHLCQRLDGIPLAIELAAARAGVLTLSQIASRLDDRFRLLTGGSRGVLTRHQTLRALIDWSYDLLTEAEQALLRWLSVFAGGWTLEAAEAIADLPESLRHEDVLDLLASLVERSLVLAEAEQAGGLRYHMLETVREYALEKLRESGEEASAREQHAEHYLALATQARLFLEKPDLVWLDRLETEHDNIRATLTCFAGQEETIDKAVWIAGSLERFWNLRGHLYERRAWLLGLALRPTPPTKARAGLLEGAGHVVAGDGDFASAKQMFVESLAIWRQLGDRQRIAGALLGVAGLTSDPNIAGPECDPIAARPLAEESLAMMRELGDRQGMAHALFLLGRLAHQSGDHDEARARWLECRAQDRVLGVKGGLVLRELGELALETGDYAAARHDFETFLSERYEIGERWGVWWSLQGLGALALVEAEPERAAWLLGASLTVRESIDFPLSRDDHAFYEVKRNALREALGEAALCAAWGEGYAMPLGQAIEYALKSYPVEQTSSAATQSQ